MIHILKQLNFILSSVSSVKFMNEVNTSWVKEELTEQNKEQYLNDNKNKIIDYIQWLDLNGDKKLSFQDLSNSSDDLLSLWRIMRALKMDTYTLQEWVNISDIVEKINLYSIESSNIISESTNNRTDLSLEVSNSNIKNRLSNLQEIDLFNVWFALNEEVNSKSYLFLRKDAQKALQTMWYDISYINRAWEKIDWENAIDWVLWNAFSRAVKQLQSDLWIQQSWNLDQRTIDSFQRVINTVNFKNTISTDNNWIEDQSFSDIRRTIEETDSSVEITFWSWRTDFVWLRENINNSSFEWLIKKLNFSELKDFYTRLINISNEKNYNTRTGRYNYTPFNISWLKNEFHNLWYQADWFFWWIEMWSLMQLTENIYRTQDKFNNWVTFREKLDVLFDHNQDWIIDNDVRFYTREKQFVDAISGESNFDNLLNNLWYSSRDQFNKLFSDNYFSARANFKDRLWILLSWDRVINPWEMLVNPNAVSEFNEFLDSVDSTVSDIVNNHVKTKDLPENVKNQIKLQSVWAVIWSNTWIGTTFDVRELTNNIIDTAWFWIINWVPWIWIWKNIYRTENGRFRVDWAIVNFIPMVSAWVTLSEWQISRFEELFPNKIDSSSRISVWSWVSTMWSSIWFDISIVNERTRIWIQRAKEEMSNMLDATFEEILSWKSFEESSFSSELWNKDIYNMLTWLLRSNWWNARILKEWTLNNYERHLYENADWFNFSWGWLWLLFVAWYFPIPVVFAHWERHSTSWNQVETFSSWTRTITSEWWYLDSNLDSNDSLISKISSYESWFTWRTRYNKGSKDLLTTTNSLEKRWDWLLQLSKWVKALRDINLEAFLNTVSADSEKWIVISTISQYMKKANDFNNWSIDSWNSNTSDFINTDRNRRRSFDTMFWFSLNNEAEQYYSILENSKWKIWKTNLMWVWFDATSSLNVEWSTVRWIDTLYTNLSILTVNWEPLLIPIKDSSKIQAFKNTISNMTNISEQVKNNLLAWIDNWSVELNFYKDPEGFDDRIIPIFKWGETIITTSWAPVIDVFQPTYNTINIWLAYTWEKRERDSDDWLTTTPWEEEEPITDWLESTPWEIETPIPDMPEVPVPSVTPPSDNQTPWPIVWGWFWG